MSPDTDRFPTPEFKHPDTPYPCGVCSKYVVPDDGDIEAGLLIAGWTSKLCADCARKLRDAIEGTDVDATIDDLVEALQEGSV